MQVLLTNSNSPYDLKCNSADFLIQLKCFIESTAVAFMKEVLGQSAIKGTVTSVDTVLATHTHTPEDYVRQGKVTVDKKGLSLNCTRQFYLTSWVLPIWIPNIASGRECLTTLGFPLFRLTLTDLRDWCQHWWCGISLTSVSSQV